MAKKTTRIKERRSPKRALPSARAAVKAPRENAASRRPAAAPALAVESSRGKYVYCVIHSAELRRFGAAGIGDNGSIVMRDHTVIPMSFGTIFKTKDDIVQLLRSAYDAFGDVLAKMRDKMEFGLKVLWDRDSIVKDIEDEDEGIHRLKNEIALQKGSTYFARMQYGRAIDAALQARSERYGSEILDRLRDVAVASRINKPIGDKMIMNAAFLVSRDQEAAFDTRVKSIAAEHEKLTFKYTGPWPPYNFVNIRLKLERV
jgi:hypothetical protein